MPIYKKSDNAYKQDNPLPYKELILLMFFKVWMMNSRGKKKFSF